MAGSSHHNLISDIIDSNLSNGDHIKFKVVSNSMAPLIRAGDSILANAIHLEEIQRGDVVVIRRDDDFLTHRAIKAVGGRWQTKGDNTVFFDPQMEGDGIIGRVTIIIKADHEINFQTFKWACINPIIAKLGELEAKAYSLQPQFRFPFRFSIKIIQKLFF